MNSMMNLMMILPIAAIFTMLIQYFHLLMAMLALEGIMLSLLMYLLMTTAYMKLSVLFFTLTMLTISACGASIGLSLLVLMTRSFGTDMMHNLIMNKC